MKTTPLWKSTLAVCATELAVVLLLHRILIETLADGNIVSRIFAGGRHVPVADMMLALLFIAVRLLVALGLPGMVLSRVGLVVFDAVWPEPPSAVSQPAEPPARGKDGHRPPPDTHADARDAASR